MKTTPVVERIMELAEEDAASRGRGSVGSESLLYAILQEGESVAAQILQHFGYKLPEINSWIVSLTGRDRDN